MDEVVLDPTADTFPKLVLGNARTMPDKVAIREKDYGIWQSYTWRDYAEEARLIALGLASLGFQRGDKTAVIGDNRPPLYWAMLATQALGLYPSLAFTAVAFTLVLLAENARIPVDNPATHLELTMIHEAMLLEYSARHLALMEWAAALKLFNYACIGFALFLPWGLATGSAGPQGLLLSIPVLLAKLAVAGLGIALIETLSAKLRVFRVPEFLAAAFLFAVLGMLVHQLLGA